MYFTSILCISMKLRENWRKEVAPLAAPARYAGFTLIELSIVLVIIGLIVGGVLVGQDMIKAAESRAMASRMESYTVAYNTFKLKYNCMPGDCNKAATFGLGPSGNGDRRYPCYGGDYRYSSPENIFGVRSTAECQRFWLHLSRAELITDNFSDMFAIPYPYPINETNIFNYYPELADQKGYITIIEYLGTVYFRTGVTELTSSSIGFSKDALTGLQMGQILNKYSVDASPVTACPTTNKHLSTNCLDAFKLPIIPLGYNTYNVPWFMHTTGSGGSVRPCMTHVSGKAKPLEDGQCNMLWRLN